MAGACGSPTPAPLTGAILIAAGGSHACAMVDGRALCWGDDLHGELGDAVAGQVPQAQSSRPVVAGVSDVGLIAAGGGHSCAVRADGEVWCWGDDTWGELGDGGDLDVNGPAFALSHATSVAVTGPSSTGRGLAREYSCALLVNGTVQCWGYGLDGEIGNGTNTGMVRAPAPVMGLPVAASLALAGTGAFAVLNDGTVATWGTTVSSTTNTAVALPGLTNVIAMAAGELHVCALLGDSTVTCWGANDYGQLGNGTTASVIAQTPRWVPGIHDGMSIAAGDDHTCVLRKDGTVWCWGADDWGQLGDGRTSGMQTTPQPVAGLKDAIAVAAGASFTCALLADTSIRCWGANDRGQLGNGATSTGAGGLPSAVVEP